MKITEIIVENTDDELFGKTPTGSGMKRWIADFAYKVLPKIAHAHEQVQSPEWQQKFEQWRLNDNYDNIWETLMDLIGVKNQNEWQAMYELNTIIGEYGESFTDFDWNETSEFKNQIDAFLADDEAGETYADEFAFFKKYFGNPAVNESDDEDDEDDEDMFAQSDRAEMLRAVNGVKRGGSYNGTSLRGHVETTYADLVRAFGEPDYGPQDRARDKVTCEWVMTFGDGSVATIYDYKEPRTPMDQYPWHIGGVNSKVVNYVEYMLGIPRNSRVNEENEADDELFGPELGGLDEQSIKVLVHWIDSDLDKEFSYKQALIPAAKEMNISPYLADKLYRRYSSLGQQVPPTEFSKLKEADAVLDEPPAPERKRPTKTKEKSKLDPNMFGPKIDQPLANTDPLDDIKRNAGQTSPQIRKASAARTRSATSIAPTDQMRDMLGRMRDIEIDPDLAPYPQDDPTQELSVDVNTQNLPAVAGQAIQAAGMTSPEFHQVARLPGNMSAMIRQLGKKLFGSMTSTPTEQIYMIGNLGGQGPNTPQEVSAVANFARQNGQDMGPGDIDFNAIMPGYTAETHQYSAAGIRFLLVKDFAGQYIYCWPEADSTTLNGQARLGNAPKQLGESDDMFADRRKAVYYVIAPDSEVLGEFNNAHEAMELAQREIPSYIEAGYNENDTITVAKRFEDDDEAEEDSEIIALYPISEEHL